MRLPSFDQIKQRKLVRWGLAYLTSAFAIAGGFKLISDSFGWPEVWVRALIIVLAVGFLAALVVAWYHGEKGAQKVSGPELAILAVLLGLAGLGVMLIGGGGEPAAQDEASETVVAGLPDPGLDQTAIAVLPFETIGGGDGVFAAGLTDELHQTLSLVPALRVTAQTSAGVFRQASVSADSIGRALRVAHLVEGTVRETGDGRVRVAVRLVDAETGLQKWTKTYDREVADAWGLQEEIARQVAAQLRIEVGAAAMVGEPPADPEVYALVVRARQLQHRGGEDPERNLFESLRLYEEAIARDSTYAPAWAGLARLRRSLAVSDLVANQDSIRELSTLEAERALALDPNQSLAHQVLGRGARNLESKRGHFERAVVANPADTESMILLATTLLDMGDEAGAIRTAERALALDPISGAAMYRGGYVYSSIGQHERAIELARARLALRPDHPGVGTALANFLAAAGPSEEAIELAQRAVDHAPFWQHGRAVLAFAYARAGHREEAERVWETVTEQHSYRAGIDAALGDTDAAFAELERSIELDEPNSYQLHTDNWFHALRDDPRWEPFAARVQARALARQDEP